MSTALDIIKQAMKINDILGATETPTGHDANDCFTSLNALLEQWCLEDLMCYYQQNDSFSTVASTANYNIGSGQTWDTTRPIKIVHATVTMNTIDYELQLMSNEEYQNISMKTLESLPRGLYYSPIYPVGIVYLYPVPNAAYTVTITQMKQLAAFANMNSTVTLPAGYFKALAYNLAVEIAPEYGKTVDPVVMKKAYETKALIKRINGMQPELHLESVFLGHGPTALGGGNGRFNIYSGF